jgi:hypothetical protein
MHCFADNDEKHFFMKALVLEGFMAVMPAESIGAQGIQRVLAEQSGHPGCMPSRKNPLRLLMIPVSTTALES